jgi:hypothetical protein
LAIGTGCSLKMEFPATPTQNTGCSTGYNTSRAAAALHWTGTQNKQKETKT